jgi:copper chaperone CopZ
MIFGVDGMTCGGCRGKVEAALKVIHPDASVTLDPPRATVPGPVTMDAVNTALAPLGKYRAFAEAEDAQAVLPLGPNGGESTWLKTYFPLLLIAGYLVVASFAGVFGAEHGHANGFDVWMTNFMAGFFLVFSFFKLLDRKGFAETYATYDVVAERWRGWGYAYPFVELGLGLAFLFRVAPFVTNLIALVVMTVSIVGVVRALTRRQTIRCACLGTVLNLPMSTVTLVEDGLMIIMSGAMLWMMS